MMYDLRVMGSQQPEPFILQLTDLSDSNHESSQIQDKGLCLILCHHHHTHTHSPAVTLTRASAHSHITPPLGGKLHFSLPNCNQSDRSVHVVHGVSKSLFAFWSIAMVKVYEAGKERGGGEERGRVESLQMRPVPYGNEALSFFPEWPKPNVYL